MSVKETLLKRRSVRHYDVNYKVSIETLSALIESAAKSPNGNNIQATRYLVIDDFDLRKQVLPVAFNQQQVTEASALVLILGDYQAFEKENIVLIHEQGYQAGYFTEQLRDQLVGAAINYYANKSLEELKLELVRDASLAAMSFILLANEVGLETITMSGYESDRLKKVLEIPDRFLDIMLIAVGKGIKSGHQTVRHEVNEIIYLNTIEYKLKAGEMSL
ncbi:nitroreductase [Planomicrobium koreense]|uniref:Nitroreductase n=1 Tax=Planococcus koreensis TaxID=112331 RepID=A0A7W8CRS1_9BACL|nr:nitroreductase family protein [Planococcus koreensis]MBB5178805.1 nitroreductase [Planococcus koreensis]